jgi:hypothetical protein
MIMEKEKISAGTSKKISTNIGCNLTNQDSGAIKTNSNCTDIKTYFIIKIILFICLDIKRKISIIRTASRLNDL